MKHIKNIFLGCENTGDIATLENHTIRFCRLTIWSHVTIMSKLGSPMWEAEYQSDLYRGPKKFCILLPEKLIYGKCKKENKSTALETISWFIENLQPNKNGNIFSIYSYEDEEETLEAKWNAQVIWPLNKDRQWVGSGDYITLHDIENRILIENRNKAQKTKDNSAYKAIREIDELPIDYDIKRIDYSMSEDEIFNTLKYSRLHVSYNGATGYSAGMINIPTIIFGWPGGIIREIQVGENKTVMAQKTGWNTGTCNGAARVHQYDWENNAVSQGPQQYLIQTNSGMELKQYLLGIKSMIWNDREYIL